MWPDRRLLDLFGIALPIVQAPMAGAMDTSLAAAVARMHGGSVEFDDNHPGLIVRVRLPAAPFARLPAPTNGGVVERVAG